MDILTYKEYWNQISSIALESLDLLGEDEDFDQDRWLHETVEYHEYIIYYYRAKQVLLYTDNEDAILDSMGSSEMTADSVGQQICNIAYWAMSYRQAFVQQSSLARADFFVEGVNLSLAQASLHMIVSVNDSSGKQSIIGSWLYANAAHESRCRVEAWCSTKSQSCGDLRRRSSARSVDGPIESKHAPAGDEQ